MFSELSHHSVNWIDGMKISRKHFLEMENFTIDRVRDAIAMGLSNHSYGLLPSEGSKSYEVFISCDYTQQINVKVVNCRAITSDGCRIEIIQSDDLVLNTSYSQLLQQYNIQPSKENVFYVVLSVDLFARQPAGEPQMGEHPPRHPYTVPSYKLSIVPASHIQATPFSASHLIIGKIIYQSGELRPVRNYIPACMAVNSFPQLMESYLSFASLLNDMETYAFRIVQKIRSKGKSSLGESVYFVLEKLLCSMSDEIIAFRWFMPHKPPVVMMEFLLQLVQTLKTGIDLLPDKDREELLVYFAEWSGVASGAIEFKLDTLLTLQYNHAEIAPIIGEIDDFMRLLADLFGKLSQLEFIGKRKGQQTVFVVEKPVVEAVPVEKKNRWSPI